MEKQQVLFFRNLFLKGFVVGVIIVLLYLVIMLTFWDTWVALMDRMFKLNEHDSAIVFIDSLMHLRILIVFFIVIPIIALHWTSNKMK